MKKYYPVDFDKDGKPIIGAAIEVTAWNGDESDEGYRQIKLTIHVNE